MEASGAELARATRRRLYRAAAVANGLGGALVFAFGSLAPGSPNPDDLERLALANGVAFAFLVGVAFPVAVRRAVSKGAPLERWLREDRPATPEEQRLALHAPALITRTSATL